MYTEAQLEAFLTTLKHEPQQADLSLYKDPSFFKALQLYAIKKIKILIFRIHAMELQALHTKSSLYLQDAINLKEPDAAHGFSMLDFCLLAGLPDMASKLRVLGATNTIDVALFKSQLEKTITNPQLLINVFNICNELMIANAIPAQSRYDALIASIKKHATVKNCTNLALLFAGITCIILAPYTGGISGAIGATILVAVGDPLFKATLDFLKDAQNAVTGESIKIELQQKILDELKQAIEETFNTIEVESKVHAIQIPEFHPEYQLNAIQFSHVKHNDTISHEQHLKQHLNKIKSD